MSGGTRRDTEHGLGIRGADVEAGETGVSQDGDEEGREGRDLNKSPMSQEANREEAGRSWWSKIFKRDGQIKLDTDHPI